MGGIAGHYTAARGASGVSWRNEAHLSARGEGPQLGEGFSPEAVELLLSDCKGVDQCVLCRLFELAERYRLLPTSSVQASS